METFPFGKKLVNNMFDKQAREPKCLPAFLPYRIVNRKNRNAILAENSQDYLAHFLQLIAARILVADKPCYHSRAVSLDGSYAY